MNQGPAIQVFDEFRTARMSRRYYETRLASARRTAYWVEIVTRLAQDAGLSYTTVHAIYANKARMVALATLEALAAELGCAPGDLIGKGKGKRR